MIWYIYISDLASHSITKGIVQILIEDGVPIVSYESGEILAKTNENLMGKILCTSVSTDLY